MNLSKMPTGIASDKPITKKKLREMLAKDISDISAFQVKLYAENIQAHLLIILTVVYIENEQQY
ncbi:MAG: hypothetical protein IPM69_09360 [Ignavibacteria bacterium]|nr:hypothetical protein [Ignavibacteria bacterium]